MIKIEKFHKILQSSKRNFSIKHTKTITSQIKKSQTDRFIDNHDVLIVKYIFLFALCYLITTVIIEIDCVCDLSLYVNSQINLKLLF